MGDEDDKSKIYVGSLSFDTDKDGLRNYFENQVGEQTVSDGKKRFVNCVWSHRSFISF